MLNRLLSYLTATLLAIGMIACGGSSSSGGFSPQPQATEELPITPDNAVGVTADVIGAVTSLFDLLELGVILPDLAVTKIDLGVSSELPFAGFGTAYASGQSTPGPKSVLVETNNCDVGFFTRTWNDADDNLEMSTGDTLDLNFVDCFFSDPGVTLGGSEIISSVEISGDAVNAIAPWSFGANIAFIDLVGTDDVGSVTINGSFDFFGGSVNGLTANMSISGTELSAMENGATDTFSNFNVTETMDLVTETVTVNAMGMLTSERRNGTVSFSTPTNLVILGSDENPSSGEIMITHATSSVRATVLDNISVQLAIDTDGDGIAETTIVVSWADLDAD